MGELRQLLRLEEQRSGRNIDKMNLYPETKSSQELLPFSEDSETKKDVKNQIDVSNDESSESSSISDVLGFHMADEIIPPDETAESTLRHDRQSKKTHELADDGEEEEPAWLKKVATLVNAKAPKRDKLKKIHGSGLNGVVPSKDNDVVYDVRGHGNLHPPSPSAILKPVPLLRIHKSRRHGCKVVNIKDKSRVVGQVSKYYHNIEVYFCN